jgi:hypothetical protein
VVTALCALVLCAAPPASPLRPPRRLAQVVATWADPMVVAEQMRDGSIMVEKGGRTWRLLWPGGWVRRLELSAEGKYLAAAMSDRVYVWDVPDGTFRFVIPFKNPNHLHFDRKTGNLTIHAFPDRDKLKKMTMGEFLAHIEEAHQEWSMKTGELVPFGGKK